MQTDVILGESREGELKIGEEEKELSTQGMSHNCPSTSPPTPKKLPQKINHGGFGTPAIGRTRSGPIRGPSIDALSPAMTAIDAVELSLVGDGKGRSH